MVPLSHNMLTHWGRVTHICVSKFTIIDLVNGLSPGRHQTIIQTNVGLLAIGPLGTNFSEILIKIQHFSFTKMHLKISSAKWRPCCLSLNVLNLRNKVNVGLSWSAGPCVIVMPNPKWHSHADRPERPWRWSIKKNLTGPLAVDNCHATTGHRRHSRNVLQEQLPGRGVLGS